MKIIVRTRSLELPENDYDFIRRRIHFALGRFSPRIRHVTVRVTDINGPRGGLDTHCSIAVTLDQIGVVRAEDTAVSLHQAVSCAADRGARAVARAFHRIKKTARTALPPRSLLRLGA